MTTQAASSDMRIDHSKLGWSRENDVFRRISGLVMHLALACIVTGSVSQIAQHVGAQLDLPSPLSPPLPDGDVPDDCEACKSLVKSFDLGLDRTMRGKHEGGDTYWEEKNLKSYADSEIRLVEIQEDLCNELTSGKAQCLKIAEESETDIEDWWFQHRNKNIRLHDHLCISKLKKCCPEGSFGPTCQTCLSDCNERGKCDGSGSRRGSGECNCLQGYAGHECDECNSEHYKMRSGDGDQFVCEPCHRACKGGCDGPTSPNCTECRAGYSRDPVTRLCLDINECELSPEGMPAEAAKRICPEGTYCVNTEGHFKCSGCHSVCSTCLDYGVDKCLTCAPNYEMDKDTHVCTHFSQLGRTNPYAESTHASIFKGSGKYALCAPYVIILIMVMATILLQVYTNWRLGQPFRGLVGMRQAIFIISCSLTSLTVIWQSGFFTNLIAEKR